MYNFQTAGICQLCQVGHQGGKLRSGREGFIWPACNLFMIRFDVSALTQARLGAAFTLDVDAGPQSLTDYLDEQPLEVEFLSGTLQATRVQGGVLVQGVLESQLKLECVRCLEPFTLPITLELEETFRLAGTSPKPDMPYSVSENGWIDLTSLLREQGWLSIPMKPLCKSDCRGLCVQCGANLNLEPCTCESTRNDPRLAVLEELL